jgi:hypothetical protein
MGLCVFDPEATYQMCGVPDEEIGMVVDCRSVADRIVSGLQQHQSQRHVIFDAADVERWQRVVRREFHVIAWPPRAGEEPPLADVIEGLPRSPQRGGQSLQ